MTITQSEMLIHTRSQVHLHNAAKNLVRSTTERNATAGDFIFSLSNYLQFGEIFKENLKKQFSNMIEARNQYGVKYTPQGRIAVSIRKEQEK